MSGRIDLMGEAALLVRWPAELAAAGAPLAAMTDLQRDPLPGVIDLVPAIDSLLVCFDPLTIDRTQLTDRLHTLATHPPLTALPTGRELVISVHYGGIDGPDLDEVAAQVGLSPQEVIDLHTATEQQVLMIGFAPGFPYLGWLPLVLHLPRRATPRVAVPAGSVAIAAGMTGIYPTTLPGGWHVIGRTDVTLFDPAADPPALLQPGDRVRFVNAETQRR
ncbi:5-oxoprolinase subunit PxpB [uncultured Chloroflexus sp.]|uniref:5-oxoprolinase subunit PxpB n=1 Tax=uncultured Chloroflexus sp. TaxID=214040 RepID=UPI00260C4521|nr:5-oxoprolinase subunit PxpB [uncultured Chloroflexus sp.]